MRMRLTTAITLIIDSTSTRNMTFKHGTIKIGFMDEASESDRFPVRNAENLKEADHRCF